MPINSICFVEFRMPFELNSLHRYVWVNIFQTICCSSASWMLVAVMTTFIGIILYIYTILGDLKMNFDRMDALKSTNFEKYFELITNFMEIHARIIKLCGKMAKLWNLKILFTFIPCVFCLCATLLKGNKVRMQ